MSCRDLPFFGKKEDALEILLLCPQQKEAALVAFEQARFVELDWNNENAILERCMMAMQTLAIELPEAKQIQLRKDTSLYPITGLNIASLYSLIDAVAARTDPMGIGIHLGWVLKDSPSGESVLRALFYCTIDQIAKREGIVLPENLREVLRTPENTKWYKVQYTKNVTQQDAIFTKFPLLLAKLPTDLTTRHHMYLITKKIQKELPFPKKAIEIIMERLRSVTSRFHKESVKMAETLWQTIVLEVKEPEDELLAIHLSNVAYTALFEFLSEWESRINDYWMMPEKDIYHVIFLYGVVRKFTLVDMLKMYDSWLKENLMRRRVRTPFPSLLKPISDSFKSNISLLDDLLADPESKGAFESPFDKTFSEMDVPHLERNPHHELIGNMLAALSRKNTGLFFLAGSGPYPNANVLQNDMKTKDTIVILHHRTIFWSLWTSLNFYIFDRNGKEWKVHVANFINVRGWSLIDIPGMLAQLNVSISWKFAEKSEYILPKRYRKPLGLDKHPLFVSLWFLDAISRGLRNFGFGAHVLVATQGIDYLKGSYYKDRLLPLVKPKKELA